MGMQEEFFKKAAQTGGSNRKRNYIAIFVSLLAGVIILGGLILWKVQANQSALSDQPLAESPSTTPNAEARAGATDVDDFIAEMREDLRSKLPNLLKRLESDKEAVRIRAAMEMAGLGPEGKAAVPVLLKALNSTDGNVSWQSAKCLAKVAPANKDVQAALIESARRGNPGAALALGHIGPAANAAIPVLLEWLEKESNTHFAQGLAGIGSEAVPPLIEALKSPNNHKKRGALMALADINPPAAEAVPSILALVNDGDSFVSSAAIHALGKAGRDSLAAANGLLTLLKGSDQFKKERAAESFGQMKAGVDEAIPLLIEMLKSQVGERPRAASIGLASIGEKAIRPLEVLAATGDEIAKGWAEMTLEDMKRIEAASKRWDSIRKQGGL